MHGTFSEFALLLLICALVGVVVGPAVLGLVTAHDPIDLLAQVGMAVLLFAVGLKLGLRHIRHIGPVALATGLGQLAFTIVMGFAIVLALGRDVMDAIYVAVARTFSSTIIMLKLRSDKRELDSLHGRIAVRFLIVQGLAVVAMMAMSALRGTGDAGGATGRLDMALALTTLLGLITLTRSTSMVLYSQPLYERLARGLPVCFGDGEDADFLESLPLKHARWVITSFPQWAADHAAERLAHDIRHKEQAP